MRVRTLLADDHKLVRAGLRKWLEPLAEIEVVGEAGDGLELMALAETHLPRLVLMDISMPGLNGLDATARLTRSNPETRVLVLSMHQDEEYVRQALRHSAAGYLLKDAAPMELDLAVRAVLRGETYLSPAVCKGNVRDYVQRLRAEENTDHVLTRRQREVLQLVVEGRSTKEIARRLDISVRTVDTHRAQLMSQLDIHEVAGLVHYAMRHGVIRP
jgi:DNA-binding NarL/FixJ family response regulator